MAETKLFSVIEYSSFFAVRHNATGEEHPMGDGVDTLSVDREDGSTETLCPGTPGFIEAWEEALNEDEDETLEAYFPELGQCSDCDKWGISDPADDSEIRSTYCGSLCNDCLREHIKECEPCNRDFAEEFREEEEDA